MDKRTNKRAGNECIQYMLNKHRDSLMKYDNDRRKALKLNGSK